MIQYHQPDKKVRGAKPLTKPGWVKEVQESPENRRMTTNSGYRSWLAARVARGGSTMESEAGKGGPRATRNIED